MNTSGRFAAFALSLLLAGGLGVTVGALPAQATVTTLCTGYAGCAKLGMSDNGYGAASRTMYWRMYAGHNCTNYIAYRMVRAGLANSRPWSGSGNATNWGSAMSSITNSTPTVGSVAWWRAGVRPAGSAGHVAYVERVVSADEIIVSQDSWHGDFSWTRVTRASSGWPSGFVHFRDATQTSTGLPTVTGTSRVGSTLTASPGVWSPAAPVVSYQWMQNGVAIAGATTSSLPLALAQQGKQITVVVTAKRLGYATAISVSTPTAAVQPGSLTPVAEPAVTGEPRVDQTLSATTGTWNPTPDTLQYQWSADGVPLKGATGPTLTTDPTLVGKAITVTVNAVKTGYSPVARTSAPTAPVAPGTMELAARPAALGTASPGQTLTVALPSPPPNSTVAVQWLRAGQPVPGATNPRYQLSAADLGSPLLAQVTVSRPGYAAITARTPARVVRVTPILQVTTSAGRGRLDVHAVVTAPGVRTVPGTIQIRSRGKLLREVTLANGSARTSLTGLAHRKRTFRILYPTTAAVTGTMVKRTIRIG